MSEARGKAHVHVVIIGFGAFDVPGKHIYEYEHGAGEPTVSAVANISPYLIAGPDVALPIRRAPLCEVPEIVNGNKPADGGFLVVEDNERADFLRDNPSAAPYLKPFLCAEEYLNGKNRWVLWLLDAPPKVIRENPGLLARVESMHDFRLKSLKASTRARATVPALFDQVRQPRSEYIVIPRHSSENRRYIPFGYFGPEIIIGDSCTAIPDATLYHFGVISSALHMAWLGHVGGRLKSDYRYSNKLVYNPWPTPTPEQRAKVEEKARAVLAAREMFMGSAGFQPGSVRLPVGRLRGHPDRGLPLLSKTGTGSLSPAGDLREAVLADLRTQPGGAGVHAGTHRGRAKQPAELRLCGAAFHRPAKALRRGAGPDLSRRLGIQGKARGGRWRRGG